MEGLTIRTNIRTNKRITAEEVRLIDESGKQLGIIPLEDAMEKAQGKELDLVEVAPDSDPPVCRIMDFNKYLYELKRKQKLARKNTHRQDTKEIKLRPNIDPHDFEFKLKHAREFLEKGHKVKLTVRYRMRELRHYEIGTQRLDNMIEKLADLSTLESSNRGFGRSRLQVVLLTPKRVPGAEKQKTEAE